MKNEHRIIRRLQAAADKEASEKQEFNKMKSELIDKQKAVTGDYEAEKSDEKIVFKHQQVSEKFPKKKRQVL